MLIQVPGIANVTAYGYPAGRGAPTQGIPPSLPPVTAVAIQQNLGIAFVARMGTAWRIGERRSGAMEAGGSTPFNRARRRRVEIGGDALCWRPSDFPGPVRLARLRVPELIRALLIAPLPCRGEISASLPG